MRCCQAALDGTFQRSRIVAGGVVTSNPESFTGSGVYGSFQARCTGKCSALFCDALAPKRLLEFLALKYGRELDGNRIKQGVGTERMRLCRGADDDSKQTRLRGVKLAAVKHELSPLMMLRGVLKRVKRAGQGDRSRVAQIACRDRFICKR